MDATAGQWPDDVFRELVALDVRQVAYVPDAGHARLIDACRADDRITAVPLTTEEEGVALLAGAWLGGTRGALLMQSSGVGNCVNMLAMTRTCRMPLLMLITMRGQPEEANPWQRPMGAITPEVLRLAGVAVHAVDESARVGEAVAAAGGVAFAGPTAVAVLIAQRVVGAKSFGASR